MIEKRDVAICDACHKVIPTDVMGDFDTGIEIKGYSFDHNIAFTAFACTATQVGRAAKWALERALDERDQMLDGRDKPPLGSVTPEDDFAATQDPS